MTNKRASANANHLHFKDSILDQLSDLANIAQFVSFGPDTSQRYCRVRGFSPNHHLGSVEDAIAALLEVSPEDSVNVRSFTPDNPKSREFIYGLHSVDDVAAHIRRLGQAGLYTIVNETVNVSDGGVSGVAFGDVLEFAPNDTPRAVEKEGILTIRRDIGSKLLQIVYGFSPALTYDPGLRVEFSVHPLRRGFRYDHTIVWELEQIERLDLIPEVNWPNRFSRHIGDKAFGLLIAHLHDLPVPETLVLPRTIAPFSFGQATGTAEVWIRTCPVEQVPGRFTTQRGWTDPYTLLSREDPDGKYIASVLAQEGVDAKFSGALVSTLDGTPIIEGKAGYGDQFMVTGKKEELPSDVESAVLNLYTTARQTFGPVRFEWVYDGKMVWIVQFHRGATETSGRTIYPGEASTFHRFDVSKGIESLRSLIAEVANTKDGIILVGDVGVTSHLGDLLRKARIPSFVEPQPT